MPIDFANMAPAPATTEFTPRRASRTSGPNPFLDNGWLEQSYANEQVMDFGPVAGDYAEVTLIRGKNKGKTATRMTGDAHTVETMLRAAANKLNIGVRIEFVKAKDGRNRERNGWWIVKYLGQERREYNRNGSAADGEEEEYDE